MEGGKGGQRVLSGWGEARDWAETFRVRRAGSGRSRGPLGRRGASGLARPGSFPGSRGDVSRSLRRRDARTSVESRSDTHQHRDGDDGATRHERPQDAPEQRRPVVLLAVVVRGAIGGRTLLGRAAVRGVLAGGAVGARHGGGSANARARWSAEPDRPPRANTIVLINYRVWLPANSTSHVNNAVTRSLTLTGKNDGRRASSGRFFF